ncbi:SAGA complex subunit Sgf73 [Elasticomyces elasticus]|nr:SAGA complex subunit Sgf73 [Elasticomyces elasticus]KAK3645013.1 SAGA complex subunit Sgf73 [Elasticomyces elasticus]KAK4905008.1 SAGA complex subunit Sgf73 [Elasticomyces elasticus]KAK5734545.1 SAGA complex subunit Sgf73 [Elasticomyces elasticus]
MAPNGARKAPAAPKPMSRPAADTPPPIIPLDDLFTNLDASLKPALKDHVRTALPVLEKPGNWDSAVKNASNKENNASPAPPPMNPIPKDIARAFPTGRLMADKPEVLRCLHCKRPVLKHSVAKHVEACLEKKQEKLRKKKEAKDARDAAARKERGESEVDGEAVGGEEGAAGKKTTGANGLTASKKRKATDGDAAGEDGAGPKKKKKKAGKDGTDSTINGKAAAASNAKSKAKAPVDVERQCGVELPLGGQCARSLTCKSHSMGAKRSVPGRSAPYDKLLAEYQRKSQARMQKAAFDANAPDPDNDDGGEGIVDEEAEVKAVMQGIALFGGAPLYEHTPAPLRSKYGHNRIRGLLASAMGDKAGGGFFGGGASSTGFFTGLPIQQAAQLNGEANGPNQARKMSVVPGARSMTIGGGASRKASVAT